MIKKIIPLLFLSSNIFAFDLCIDVPDNFKDEILGNYCTNISVDASDKQACIRAVKERISIIFYQIVVEDEAGKAAAQAAEQKRQELRQRYGK